jgi:hypothetical protein
MRVPIVRKKSADTMLTLNWPSVSTESMPATKSAQDDIVANGIDSWSVACETPGTPVTDSRRRSRSATVAALSSLTSRMLSITTSTDSASNPSRTSRTLRRLRTNSPAPTRRTTERAHWSRSRAVRRPFR